MMPYYYEEWLRLFYMNYRIDTITQCMASVIKSSTLAGSLVQLSTEKLLKPSVLLNSCPFFISTFDKSFDRKNRFQIVLHIAKMYKLSTLNAIACDKSGISNRNYLMSPYCVKMMYLSFFPIPKDIQEFLPRTHSS